MRYVLNRDATEDEAPLGQTLRVFEDEPEPLFRAGQQAEIIASHSEDRVKVRIYQRGDAGGVSTLTTVVSWADLSPLQ